METKPIPREQFLELENHSLKLHIMQRNVQDQDAKFKAAIAKAYETAGLTPEDWALNLDSGQFVKKILNGY